MARNKHKKKRYPNEGLSPFSSFDNGIRSIHAMLIKKRPDSCVFNAKDLLAMCEDYIAWQEDEKAPWEKSNGKINRRSS